MALPTYNDQVDFVYLVDGFPQINVFGKPTDTSDFGFLIDGFPYYATSPGGTPPVTYNATQFFMMF